MARELRVLVVEDSEDDARLLIRRLTRAGYEVSWERVETAAEMLSALERGRWEIVIADYVLPRFGAPVALRLLQEAQIDLPFIIVSGSIGEDLAAQAMKAGAHDYILKTDLKRLVPAVERELEQARHRRARRQAEETIRQLMFAVDQSASIVFMTDPEARITYVNPAFEAAYGFAKEDVLGKNPRLLKSGRHGPDYYAKFWQAVVSGDGFRGEVTNRAKDGRLVTVEVSANSVFDADGARIGFMAVQHDVTERRRTEDALRTSEQHKSSLLRLSRRLEQAHTYSQIIEAALGEVGAVLGFQNVWAYLLSEDGQTASLMSCRGGLADLFQQEIPVLAITGDPFAPEVITAKGPVVVEDAQIDPRTDTDIAARLQNRTIIDVPMLLADRRIGALGTGSFGEEGVRVPDASQLDYFSSMASHVAVAFDRVRLLEDRKRAEDALRRAEERYRGIFENAVVGIYQTSLEGRFMAANPTLARIYGYESPEELMASVTDVARQLYLQPGRREEFARLVGERGAVRDFESQAYRRDGSVIWISENARAIRDAGGGLAGFEGTAVEITARKLAEEERQRLAAILDATPDFVGLTDPEGRPVYLNRAARALLGIGPARDLATVRLADGHPEWARKLVLETAIPAAIRDGVWQGETAFLDGKGREVPFSQVVLAHKSPEGGVMFLSTIARDLSEQKGLEAQLRQSQKMEAIGQLAGGVAHDFNNLLGVIRGYGDLLEKDIGPQHAGRRRVEQILKAADRAAALTRQLLAFSRKQVLEPRLLDLNAVLADIEKMLRRLIGEHIQLVTVLTDGLWRTMADPGQIEQVILNLAVNARDAMPGGGKLILEMANVELDEAYAHSHAGARPGPHVMLAVSDTGHGIAAETLTHIFEPFFTTKEQGKGTGLGLATVYGIVRQSGGHVNVYSELGRGSTFKVYLPRVEGEAEVAASVRVSATATGGSETILLAEDDASLRAMIQEILETAGYTVLGGAKPDEVLAVARSYAGAVYLLLTDMVMPGMNGRELARQLQAVQAGVRVLYMSGYTNEAIDQEGVLGAGAAFLQKPFTYDSLLRKVREVLDAPSAAATEGAG